MAFSPSPCTFSSSSCKYTSSHFLLLRPQTHFSIAPRGFNRFRLSCSSRRLVQVDTERHQEHQQEPQRVKVAVDVTKQSKKRKPRPSFLAQIHDKWSAKLGPRREKFPWQEEREQEGEAELETEPKTELDTGIRVKATSLSDSVSFRLTSSAISAPWSHGVTEPLKPPVDLEPETQEDSDNCVFSSGVHIGNDISMPSNSSHREFDEIPEGNWKEEDRAVLTDAKGFSLSESLNRNEKDGDLASSGYGSGDSDDDPWENVAKSESGRGEKFKWKRSNTAVAEKTLPEHELRRLRNVSLRMVGRIKVGARGITQDLVDSIREKWKLDEAVKLKFEEPLSLNMRRTHGILENKTGGLVIWRSGSSVVLYRGMTYNLPCVQSYTKQTHIATTQLKESEAVKSDIIHDKPVKDAIKPLEFSTPISAAHVKGLSGGEIKHLNELNTLLDELGPRFTDWLGREPLPVDADLLPAVIPDYKTPFRLLPYGVKHCIGNKEMTRFRRTARTMPPHFALGRNRELQGLAQAMVKLWEKSAIAKIAIKRGVQNTCNERMAVELRMLTGGTLLSRNKDYIVFYRGNDFLPPPVTEILKERRILRDLQQDKEEQVRQMAPAFIESKAKPSTDQLVAGTLAETKAAAARWGRKPSSVDVEKMIKDFSLARHESIIRHLERQLAIAKGNLTKAEKALAKLQEDLNPSNLPDDLETITDEERFLFHKMGLTMKPFLLLGRRGLYDGTIENMHLHWKYRELVKIIMKAKHFEQVKHVAISLEAESGGVLVSIDKTLKGYAIIVYRGKNYQSPVKIRPKNLLTRRQALAHSTELQRRQALRHHISDLQERIGLLKSELVESRNGRMIGDEGMSHSKVEHSLLSDDEGTSHSMVGDSLLSNDEALEDDDKDAYLEIFDSGNEESSKEHEELR